MKPEQPTHCLTLADGTTHQVQVSESHDEFWTDAPINHLSKLVEVDADDPDCDPFFYTTIAALLLEQGTLKVEKL